MYMHLHTYVNYFKDIWQSTTFLVQIYVCSLGISAVQKNSLGKNLEIVQKGQTWHFHKIWNIFYNMDNIRLKSVSNTL
jgi:hypothetical protein